MKIRFKKKRLKHYLIFGILWLILGSAAVIFNSDNFFNYGYLTVGMLYFGTYLFENKRQYLTIENGIISKNHLIPKRVNLIEITRIKAFAGDYTLTTKHSELKINTDVIDENSLMDLNKVLAELNLPPDKTPFTSAITTPEQRSGT